MTQHSLTLNPSWNIMERLSSTKEILGDHLYQKVKEAYRSHFADYDGVLNCNCKITGILLERSVEHIYQMLTDDDVLKNNIQMVLDSIAIGRKPKLQVTNKQSTSQDLDDTTREEIAQQLFDKVYQLHPQVAPQITGMLMELENHLLVDLLQDSSKFISLVAQSKRCLEDAEVEGQNLESREEDFSYVIYQRAHSIYKEHAPKITGMILEMDDVLLRQTVDDQQRLDEAIAKAYKVLQELPS